MTAKPPPGSSAVGDARRLDRDRNGKRDDADRRPRRADRREIFAVDLVEGREVAVHVRQEDRDVDDLLERAAGVFENGLDVRDARARLSLDSLRNLLGLRMPRSDPGKEDQIPDPAPVRIRAERPGRPGGIDGIHAAYTTRACAASIAATKVTSWNRRRSTSSDGSTSTGAC